MRLWFATGIEPWLLPPAVEMGHALVTEGHEAYALYIGDPPAAGDELGFSADRVPRRNGVRRLMAAADLSALIRRALRQHGPPDLLIACDLIALQAARALRRHLRALGYWAFEIVERPAALPRSGEAWRANRLPAWIRDCDVVLAPSASRLHRVRQLAAPASLTLVVPNCRCDRAHPLKRCSLLEGHRVSRLPNRLVYAGRVSPTQYVLEIVDALRLMPNDVGLIVAGIAFPEYREQLEEHVRRHQLGDRCLLVDRLSRAEADAVIAQATLGFVMYDSASDAGAADPAPNKVGDYAAFGVPMVGTCQDYLRYWLEDRGMGVCVTGESPEAIATATRALLDPARISGARAACAAAAKEELNMRVHALSLVGELRQRLGTSRAGTSDRHITSPTVRTS